MMSESPDVVVNVDDAEEVERLHGEHFGAFFKVLTPSMKERGGCLGVNQFRVPPGRTVCPFHYHQREDEVFFVMSGEGLLRYGEQLSPLRVGDCISCPAGTQLAHQIANTGDVDLVYLAIGRNDPDEVCVYPDSGKVLVRSLKRVGQLANTDYFADEPEKPRIFELAASKGD